jgi:mannose-6-phosphate isomerase-like protein (cupin superfamily)
MKVRNYSRVERRDAFLKDKAKGVSMRVAIAEEDGAKDSIMRILEVDPEGFTPLHTHEYEHMMFVLRGKGLVTDGAKECRLEKDDVLFVPTGQAHQIRNTGDVQLVIVSVLPVQRD